MFSSTKKYIFLTGLLSIATIGLARVNYEEIVLSNLVWLFYPLNDAQGYESLDKIKKYDRKLYNDLMEVNGRTNNALWWQTFIYNANDVVNGALIDQIILFAQEVAVQAVMKNLNDYSLAQGVAVYVKKEIQETYNHYVELPRGVFKKYFGTEGIQNALKQANVLALHHNTGYHAQQQHYQVSPQIQSAESTIQFYIPKGELKLYPDTECCICFTELDETNRVFLPTSDRVRVSDGLSEYDTCGHDMCKSCAKSNFFKYNQTDCPKCRTKVSKNMLTRILKQNK